MSLLLSVLHALRALALVGAVVWSSGASHAQPVLLNEAISGQSLAAMGRLHWLVDERGGLEIGALREPALQSRMALAPHPVRNGSDARAHWLRVDIEQRGGTTDWVLAMGTTALKAVDFHGPFDAEGKALAPPVLTGLSRPYDTRPLGSERYVMRLHLDEPGTYTVFVRVVSETSQNLDLALWPTADYLQWRQHKRLFDGICYGILLALLIYNLVLAGVFRDRSYLYYVCQCGFALMTLASFNGHAAHYLWGGWPWWQERANVVAPALWLLFAAQFARHFLDTPRMAPRMDVALKGLAVLAGAGALVALGGFLAAGQGINEATAAVGTVVATVAAVRVWRAGFAPALWHLGGQGMLFAAALAVVLVNWELIDAPFLLANGLQMGVAAEMVVFAIALSNRIRGMRSNQIELRLRAAHLAEAAATDPLTGLANRTGLTQGAQRVLVTGGSHALMLLDLDRFKPINDEHGHDAGDAVLMAVAERLQSHMRGDDLVARLGGDEFVVLLGGDLSDKRLEALAQRLGEAIRRPVDYHGQALSVGVSIGIARCPEQGRTLPELMRAADQAMYRAKEAGDGFAFYEDSAAA